MEELISQLVSKTGISPEQAKNAAELVLNFVKSKVPAMGGQLDSIISQHIPTNLGDVASKLGGMFGK